HRQCVRGRVSRLAPTVLFSNLDQMYPASRVCEGAGLERRPSRDALQVQRGATSPCPSGFMRDPYHQIKSDKL
ncbi:hypothetical protein CH063_11922, partial [Colletotrichum higginsianum]